MNMDRGTLLRSVALGIVLLNQALVNFGLQPIPGNSDAWYNILSTIATIAVAVISWFKNNYITFRGKQQREVLIEHGLTEK